MDGDQMIELYSTIGWTSTKKARHEWVDITRSECTRYYTRTFMRLGDNISDMYRT